MPVRKISCMIRVKMYVRRVGLFLGFVDLFSDFIEETLMWALIYFEFFFNILDINEGGELDIP